jgi:hypothetical protein
MPAYQNNALASYEAMVALVIADLPTTITREREAHTDPFRGKTTATAGPYTQVRIEPFRASRVYPTFDEKGSVATTYFIMTALNIPKEVAPGVPTFRIDDIIIDSDGNRYRATGPGRYTGNVLELNLELEA